jgi:polyhydroxybutyrate depolymerase
MKHFLLSLLLLLSFVMPAQTPASITHDGLTREFIYYTPSNWNTSQQLPLMIVLHGLTQTGAGVMNITQFNVLAEQYGFFVVYPDGINNAWNANMNIAVSTADDLGFIESLAQYFQNNFGTNPLRQYLVGFSNGGFMSHKVACESSMCFAGIASVAGNMSDTTAANCDPSFLPAILHLHGTADAVVPYNGSVGTGISVDETILKWRTFLTCDPLPSTVNMPNTNAFDFSSPQRITYVNGVNDLELIKINGGGHQWPGISTLVGGAGTINMDFYSPQVIWEFLSGKSCSTNQLEETSFDEVKVYPNPARDTLHLSCPFPVQFSIFSNDGRMVINGPFVNSISLEGLEPGNYFIRLETSSGIAETRQLIHIEK